MKNIAFLNIWDQLVLFTQSCYSISNPNDMATFEKQAVQAKEKGTITNRQYLALINAIYEWRDILYLEYKGNERGND